MKRKENFLPVFLVVAFLCILILTFSLSGKLKFITSLLEKRTSQIQEITFNVFKKLPFISQDLKIARLKEKNLELLDKLIDLEKLKKENAALSDQFQTSFPRGSKLLKTDIIGAPGFIPGVSLPANYILNKGSKDNVKVGQAVVIKNNLVGKIVTVSQNLSVADIINNSSLSFTTKTEKGAVGVVRNIDGNLTLDNVILSENIKPEELVLTKGDMNSEGLGIPPDLVIGKIVSVEKNASDLFQRAKLASFLDFTKLSTVFIFLNSQ